MNNENHDISDEEIISQARGIAIEMLKSKRGMDNKNSDLLEDAILKSDKINKSEVRNA